MSYESNMNKLLLLLLLSLGLSSISYANNAADMNNDDLCGWKILASPHIVTELYERRFNCDGDVAIKTVKTPIVKDLTLTRKLKRWNKMIRGKRPIYTTKTGTNIKVDPFGCEKSIKLNKSF